MDSHDLHEIRRLLENGRKIESIKLIREKTGLGLKEAKDLADEIADGANLFEISAKLGGQSRPSSFVRRDLDLTGIWDALRNQMKIQAIKLYREQTGVNLKEAKEAVEALEREGIPPAPYGSGSESGASAVDSTRTGSVVTPESFPDVIQALRNGKKIQAIKLYREKTGLGLRDAKMAVDQVNLRSL